MKSTTTIAATVALLSSAHALTPEQNAQVNVVVQDIRGHLSEYLQFAQNNPGFHVPDGLMDVYSKAATYTDNSYTTLFDEVNMDQFTQAVTQLPWYSERILPSLVPGAQGAAPTPAPAAPAPAPAAPAPAPAEPAPAAPAPAPAAPAPAAPAPAATEGGDSGSNSQSSSSGEGSHTSSSARPSASAAANGTHHHNSTSSGHHSSTSSRGSGDRTSVRTTRAAGEGQSLQALSTGFGIFAAGIAGLLL